MMKCFLLPTLLLVLPPSLPAAERVVVEIGVAGMSCEFCAYGVRKNLKKIPGIEQAVVSLEAGMARIVMAPGQAADVEVLRRAINAAGFTPEEVHTASPAK